MRIACVACAGLLALAPAGLASAQSVEPAGQGGFVTQWNVQSAAGLDAVLMLGVGGGDVLQAHYYADTAAFMRERMSPEAVAAMDRVGEHMRSRGGLTGPALALVFSAGHVDSLADVIRSASDPDTHLRPQLETSPNWDEARYDGLMQLMPDIRLALEGLRDIGFDAWYASEVMPLLEPAIAANLQAVSAYDIIPEQARLLGTPLSPQIDIIIVRFAQPYGIRILGQRFIAYYGWDADIQLRVAAHEIFHPPFDREDPEILSRLASLEADPWMQSIVTNHNPDFGYNSFMGVVNEDSTQALDQIVSERIGVARDPGQRWSHADGGMHLLAAALYHAMKEDGFDETGGHYARWLISAFDRGMLTPQEVRRRASEVVGPDPVQHWYDVMTD
jgi:hypothetical protein